MPQTLGAQRNPFTCLDVSPNASGAHLTQLGGGWEEFYTAKRSSATRRRDRAKRRHMSEYGDVQFATAAEAADARRTLEILMEQNSRALVRKGVADMFARPGWREFFLDLATNPQTRQLVHVARLQVGADAVAANFGVVFGGCYYHVLASYCEDSRAAHFGPGALHLRELLKYAIERGLQRFDFTIGDERYKLEWCDSSLKLYDHAAAATWRGWPACARCGRAAPAQAPDQADALGVERGLRCPHCAWLILAPGAAVKRGAAGRRREHPPGARQWSGFDIRAGRAATREANVNPKLHCD